MTNPDCTDIMEQLQYHPNNGAQWEIFMHYLNTRIRLGFEEDGEEGLFQHVDWSVQEGPELQNADEDEVRA
ncbi:hypothetical protein B5807_07223 [Epicoccum nigrum]|uniref:Uncharacterized protein n=1 Tax=Epicoccum nigrum TaxID=105696 RepID=A0A1Y2LV28_EPING|nr:hypothetical protein B5807_07223 [Epicoccum nigrum]